MRLPALPGAVIDFGTRSLRWFVEIESSITWLSIVILVLSATSFTRDAEDVPARLPGGGDRLA